MAALGYRGRDGVWAVLDREESLYQGGDSGELGEICGVVSAEDQAVLGVAFYGADQGLGDAVGGGFGAAFF